MSMPTQQTQLHLDRNEVARLSGARTAQLLCVDGTTWITIDGDRRDIVLERGQSFDVEASADVIVSAIGGATAVEIQARTNGLQKRPPAPQRAWQAWLQPALRGE